VGVLLLAGCSIDDRVLSASGTGSLSPGGSGGGGGAPAGALTVAPTSVDLGGVTQGFAARARLRVSNPGGASVDAPVVAWASGSDPDLMLIQNLCSGELLPGEACDLRVQVVPSRVGPIEGALQIAGVGASSASLPFRANGLAPGPLVLQPAAGSFEDFGGVRLGASAEGVFVVTNTGAAASGAVSFAFNRSEFAALPAAEGDCAPGVTDLAAGETCDLRVIFAPAERGTLEATLSVSGASAGSRSLTLRGEGLAPAALALSASLVDFGGVVPGDTASLDVEVQNAGDEPLALAGAQLSALDASVFRIADGNCGTGVVLAAGDRCRVQLDYRPVTEGQPSAGELLITSLGGDLSERIALQGVALTRGNLLVEALEPGREDFGDVLLGERVSRGFRVSNPAQQASGALSLTTRNGFSVDPPSGAGACEVGVTELGSGQSCSVQVTFAPTSRGNKPSALTVSSSLAGAKSLAIQGRGIAPAVLEADTGRSDALIDFGAVTVQSSGNRTLTLRNAGDQPLLPPELRVGGSPTQAAAFGFESGCGQALEAGTECQVALTFAPDAVAPYAASLELGSLEQRTSVLLLGEGLAGGRLTLAASDGAAPDFGDVPVGSALTRSFTVTNPGGGVSGGLSLRASDNQFVVAAGACAEAGSDGLADGESCSFDVTFRPLTSAQTEARLSALAAATGETGIAVRGRGRLPGVLVSTATERDLGRANVGLPGAPANAFVWTIDNGGDLPILALGVSNANPDDFDVTAETCSAAPVAGGGSCTVTIGFSPNAAGDRATSVTVTDAGSARAVALQVTGFGVQLAAPGEACLASSDCMAGVCTAGVCCAQDCNLTCQSCATGECLALSNQEPCGNSGGVCFGLEQCELPAGVGCTDSSQCGGALVCKECLNGTRQCTPPDACCGGCGAGHQCVGGECGCPLQVDGRQQIDCGAGLCALNRANACCPSSPPAGCNCDPSDNLCKQCLQNADCTDGPDFSVATCSANRTCSYACQLGFKSCNGGCIANAECCGGCGAGQDCVNGQCLVDDGGSCQLGGAQCASGNCSQGRCCPQSCGTGGCNAQGSCACPGGQTFARGACRGNDGQPCTTGNDCVNGCSSWSVDSDGDTFGDEFGPETRVCGNARPVSNATLVRDRTDCCDASRFINPSITTFSENAGVSNPCPGQIKDRDLNCDDRVEYEDNRILIWNGQCDETEGNDASIPCNQRGGIFDPFTGAFGPVFVGGDANLCGNSSIQVTHCEQVGGACTTTITLSPGCR